MTIQQGTVDDLKAVFLAVHDSSITTTIPEVAVTTGLKRQYVKELIGVLQNLTDEDGDSLVVLNSAPGENGNDEPHDWWQTGKTTDMESNEDAAARFDRVIANVGEAPRTPLNATNPADLPMCRCGCRVPVNDRKRNYLPGHDARHAGQVGKAIAAKDPKSDEFESMLAVLPTDALRRKASDIATRRLHKAATKTAPTRRKLEAQGKTTEEIEAVQFVSGEVKVGRWKYPAERNMTSGAVTFKRKDKIEVATDKVAATFDPQVIDGDGSTSSLEA